MNKQILGIHHITAIAGDPQGRVRSRRADCTGHRSVGQHADRHVSYHKDQPEGLRVDVEHGFGDRRIPGGR